MTKIARVMIVVYLHYKFNLLQQIFNYYNIVTTIIRKQLVILRIPISITLFYYLYFTCYQLDFCNMCVEMSIVVNFNSSTVFSIIELHLYFLLAYKHSEVSSNKFCSAIFPDFYLLNKVPFHFHFRYSQDIHIIQIIHKQQRIYFQ